MTPRRSTGTRVTLALALLAFVALGLPDGVLGVAWPSIRDELELPLDALGALLIAATVGYVVSSFSSGCQWRWPTRLSESTSTASRPARDGSWAM